MNVTLLHNPSSGDGGPSAAELTELVEHEGHAVRYRDSAEELDRALAEEADLVVVAGGDGTIGRVLRRVPTRMPVALIPLGSANNIAHALGQVAPAAAVARGLDDAERRRFDIAWARGPWGRRRFVEGVGFGPLARALAAGEAAGLPGDGSVRFGRAALKVLLDESDGLDIHITLDGEELADEMCLVEVLNIDRVGPRLRLAPTADPGDGKLDVFCVPAAHADALLAWLDAPDVSPPPGIHRRVARAVIRSARGVAVHVDDDVIEVAKDEPLEVEVGLEDEPLTVLVVDTGGGT